MEVIKKHNKKFFQPREVDRLKENTVFSYFHD